jgi:hypothetical protein
LRVLLNRAGTALLAPKQQVRWSTVDLVKNGRNKIVKTY